MMEHSAAVAPSEAPVRLFRSKNPATALGLAASYLMAKPAFARLPFGEWSRVLIGQINRRHYVFAIDRDNRIVGFSGWALASEAQADAWLRDDAAQLDERAPEGDCIILNAWAVDSDEAHRVILSATREAAHGRRLIYTKRVYSDGRVRRIRMPVNAFVGRDVGKR